MTWKKLALFLMVVLPLGAQDVVINVQVTVDSTYVQTIKEYIACGENAIGLTGDVLATCVAADVTDVQLRAAISRWSKDAAVREIARAVGWIEVRRPSVLPADHAADIASKKTLEADIKTKRNRATK